MLPLAQSHLQNRSVLGGIAACSGERDYLGAVIMRIGVNLVCFESIDIQGTASELVPVQACQSFNFFNQDVLVINPQDLEWALGQLRPHELNEHGAHNADKDQGDDCLQQSKTVLGVL
jgi:hypothetical protein